MTDVVADPAAAGCWLFGGGCRHGARPGSPRRSGLGYGSGQSHESLAALLVHTAPSWQEEAASVQACFRTSGANVFPRYHALNYGLIGDAVSKLAEV
jgi:hypothetical protein